MSLSCERFAWLLPALADADATARQHLDECAECHAEWAATATLLGEVAIGLPLRRAPDLRAVITARIAASPARQARRASWLPYAAAAALVLGAASLPLNWRGGGALSRESAVAQLRHSTPAALTATAAPYEFEDALIAGAADTGEDTANFESRLFSGTADGLPDLN